METDQSKINRREFDRLAAPLYDNVYGAAMRLTRDPAEAEDLRQDTMVRAWRFWGTFIPGSNIKAWLFTILRNTFINGYHKEGRRSAGLSDVAAHMSALGDNVSVGLGRSSDCDAEQHAAAERVAAAIRAAVATLPVDYRLAVELCDLEGCSYKEIADLMECPIGTVMSRIFRGRKALRKLLADQAEDLGITVTIEEPMHADAPVQLSLGLAA